MTSRVGTVQHRLAERERVRLRVAAGHLAQTHRRVVRDHVEAAIHLEPVRRLDIEHRRDDVAVAVGVGVNQHPGERSDGPGAHDSQSVVEVRLVAAGGDHAVRPECLARVAIVVAPDILKRVAPDGVGDD